MVTKIISGAQTGADRAGLDAALQLGMTTGGTMPQGFRAQDGDHPEFAVKYGIQEHESREYPPRTALNVNDSDGTVRFALNFNSPGEKCTLNAIIKCGRPHFDVDLRDPPSVAEFRAWIRWHNIRVLNVAGNAETKNFGDRPGPIYKFVLKYLVRAFSSVDGITSGT